ncbi:AbrB family transcriptional regulator [Paracoccus gahaiensis]|nr:AbrB family transcriptional regulator [Paracoccus gahaiensis]
MRPRQLVEPAAIYLWAIAGGALFNAIGAPLPWMIGPLIFTAILYLAGVTRFVVPVKTRPVGQIIVAAQVGLSFSPAALAVLFDLAPLLIGMAVATAACAALASLVLARLSGMGGVPALLSTIPTSPVEAAVIAERLSLPTGPIIFAQTLRIASIVVIVPLAIYAVEGWPDRGMAIGGPPDMAGSAMLFGVAVAVALLFRALGISNPFFLGALAGSAGLTAAGIAPAPFAPVILAAAQVLLGTWLGSSFRRSLFASAGRMIGAIVVSTLLFVALTSLVAVGLAVGLGMNWENLVLGAAPGGVTEMALTAKYLGLDVALITAFHLVRIFLIVPFIPAIARALHRRGG